MTQIFFNIYYGNDFIPYVFHANLLTVSSSSFAERARRKRREIGSEGRWAFSHNQILCALLLFAQAFLHDYVYPMRCMYAWLFFYSISFYPFLLLAAAKTYSTKFAYLNVYMKGAHFLNVKGTPRWKRRRSPPPPSSPRKLFADFIVYKMRARLCT